MPAPRRSDARRNRAAILRAACEWITQGGQVPSARQIARLTGLGQATVYRHFPDRRSLLLAMTEEHFALLRRAARRRADDPAAFGALLRAVMVYQVSMRPLVDELRRIPLPDVRSNLRKLLDALREPFTRCQEAGLLKRGVALEDVPLVLTMLQAAIDSTPDGARRAIPLLLDGLLEQVPAEPVP